MKKGTRGVGCNGVTGQKGMTGYRCCLSCDRDGALVLDLDIGCC